jgi:predicted acylesterase/phospholipase RssA
VSRKKKTALVLAGGGFPAYMYEIGCLTALDDFFCDGFSSNDFDVFVGTSAGAAVAALIANGVKPRRIYEDIQEDRQSVFNFRRTDIYSFGYQETLPMLKKFFKSLIPIFRFYYSNRSKFSILDLFYMLQENLPSGIFTLKNFDRYLSSFFALEGYSNDFRKLKRELYIPAVDIDTGRYDVFGEGAYADVPISLAVTASSAMPIVFQPVHIRGKDYVDGGVGRAAHVDIAINHHAELFLIINPILPLINDREKACMTSFSGECAGIKDKGMSFIFDQAMRANTFTRIYMSVKRYQAEHPKMDFLMIQPDPTETVMFQANVINMNAKLGVLHYGYTSTVRALKQNFSFYQQCFDKAGIQVTKDRFKE